jgi:myo-inositol-1(or 4)-monophosphatase
MAVFEEVFRESSSRVAASRCRSRKDDQRLESWMADQIAGKLNGVRVVGEEHTRREPSGDVLATVVIDPIDGSLNYYRGLGDVGTAMAIVESDGLTIGGVTAALVGNLMTGWHASAVRGHGVRESSRVGRNSQPEQFLAFDFDGPVDFEVFERLKRRYPHIRRLGSTTLELALVSTGRFDAFADARGTLTPENFLAPALLIEEAGGGLHVRNMRSDSALEMEQGYAICATAKCDDLSGLRALLDWNT